MKKINSNLFNNFINFLLKYGLIIVSITVGIIGILSIFITAYFNSTFYHAEEKTYFKYSFGLLEIIITVIVVLLIFLLVKKILKKIPAYLLLITICIFVFSLFIYWINAIKLNPEADQKIVSEMASSILNGYITYYIKPSQYLFLYPYQFPLSLLFSVIYKLFGENFIYIHYLNAICSIINIVLIFYISKLIFKKESIQKILALLLGGFSLYWMFFNVHFYGNIIGLTLALLATLFTILYLENQKFYYLILTGISIALAILVKKNYNIFLCGIILVLILNIFSHTEKNVKNKLITILPSFLIGYLIINLSYNRNC